MNPALKVVLLMLASFGGSVVLSLVWIAVAIGSASGGGVGKAESSAMVGLALEAATFLAGTLAVGFGLRRITPNALPRWLGLAGYAFAAGVAFLLMAGATVLALNR